MAGMSIERENKVVAKALFSSNCSTWGTPDYIFGPLNEEFNFEIDLAASKKNTKCAKFFDKKQNSLKQKWHLFKCAWLNSPYGRGVTIKWVRKAYKESLKGVTVVCLLPARTDTVWFQKYCYNRENVELRFLKGRIKFVGARHGAPFPSVIVIFHARKAIEFGVAPERKRKRKHAA